MKSPPRLLRRSWPQRALSFFRFCGGFLWALVAANLQMARVVLFRPLRHLTPAFIKYPIKDLSNLEVVLLSHCITLTPGTTSVEISADRTTLVIHALDGSDPAAVCRSIQSELEMPMLAWTR